MLTIFRVALRPSIVLETALYSCEGERYLLARKYVLAQVARNSVRLGWTYGVMAPGSNFCLLLTYISPLFRDIRQEITWVLELPS